MPTFIYTKTVGLTNFGKCVAFALTVGMYHYLTKPRCGISTEPADGITIDKNAGLINGEIIER